MLIPVMSDGLQVQLSTAKSHFLALYLCTSQTWLPLCSLFMLVAIQQAFHPQDTQEAIHCTLHYFQTPASKTLCMHVRVCVFVCVWLMEVRCWGSKLYTEVTCMTWYTLALTNLRPMIFARVIIAQGCQFIRVIKVAGTCWPEVKSQNLPRKR